MSVIIAQAGAGASRELVSLCFAINVRNARHLTRAGHRGNQMARQLLIHGLYSLREALSTYHLTT